MAPLPAPAAAEGLAIAAALCTAALALLVYIASASHLSGTLSRMAVAAPVVLIPQDEVLNSVANVHWPALYALFWLILWTPATRAGKVLAVVVTTMVVASDVLVVALAPLLVLRLVVRRDRYSVVLAAAFGAVLAVQATAQVVGESRQLTVHSTYWLDPFLYRVVPAAVLGPRWPGGGVGRYASEVGTDWRVQATLAWLLVLAAVVVALARRRAANWALAGVAAIASVALYALPVWPATPARMAPGGTVRCGPPRSSALPERWIGR